MEAAPFSFGRMQFPLHHMPVVVVGTPASSAPSRGCFIAGADAQNVGLTLSPKRVRFNLTSS